MLFLLYSQSDYFWFSQNTMNLKKMKTLISHLLTIKLAFSPLLVPELDITYHHYTINPAKGSIIKAPSGAEIVVPVNAFLDTDGNIVTENVEISYRDFYHPLEFYLAGIPMNFTQDGMDQVFESAGMV